MSDSGARIGVFGGSGFYELLQDVEAVKVDTPYGPPSDSISLATHEGQRVAFLPRHGRNHTIPPHMINYRANAWAMNSLGVRSIISPCACGSLQAEIEPGQFVVSDQIIDRTKGRLDTFYDGPITTHVSYAEPFDSTLRKAAIESINAADVPCRETGTIVVIQGPRFSTKAESEWFAKMGWHTINMTQYPEGYLCTELGMGVVNIALVTDYDSGVSVNREPVRAQEVIEVFQSNAENARKVVLDLIARIPEGYEPGDRLTHSRGDGHAASDLDIRLFE